MGDAGDSTTDRDGADPDTPADWGELIARLTYVYGIDPDKWLTSIPSAIVLACGRMLPRLQAEESMRQANVFAFGAGHLDENASKEIAERWQRQAQGITAPNQEDGQAVREKRGHEALRAHGFKVNLVPKVKAS